MIIFEAEKKVVHQLGTWPARRPPMVQSPGKASFQDPTDKHRPRTHAFHPRERRTKQGSTHATKDSGRGGGGGKAAGSSGRGGGEEEVSWTDDRAKGADHTQRSRGGGGQHRQRRRCRGPATVPEGLTTH